MRLKIRVLSDEMLFGGSGRAFWEYVSRETINNVKHETSFIFYLTIVDNLWVMIWLFMKQGRLNYRNVANIGENAAKVFLMKHGYKVLHRNYLKKCGEIDIVAEKAGKLVFVEVKTVSRESMTECVKHETFDTYRPEENVHFYKLSRLKRTIGLYLLESYLDQEPEYQIDVISIVLFMKQRVARVTWLKNVV